MDLLDDLADALHQGVAGRDLAGDIGAETCRDLAQSGLKSLVVWALSDNEPATGFYRALGGKAVARSSEKFGNRVLDKVAFAWNG